MLKPDIELTDDERRLFDQIDFDWDVQQHEGFERNADGVEKLIATLLERNGLPEHRLEYFYNPNYRTGRKKGSRRDLFLSRGNADREILRHPNFLRHARYFVCGPDLPAALTEEFRKAVKRCGQVSSGDSIQLADLARRQVRGFGLNLYEAADEYFRLALDCGMWVSHALHIERRVREMRC